LDKQEEELNSKHAKVIQNLSEQQNRIEKAMRMETETPETFAKKMDYIEKWQRDHEPSSKIAVKDAIIVEPHSKDQIIMGKTGGPFDKVLKDVLQKLDALAIAIGMSGNAIVQATMASGSSVAQAVGSSGGSNGPTTGGNYDPIRDFRERARTALV
jgi:hypothetical protein